MADKKSDKSVVRNAQYKRGGLSVRQRHNKRQLLYASAVRALNFKEGFINDR